MNLKPCFNSESVRLDTVVVYVSIKRQNQSSSLSFMGEKFLCSRLRVCVHINHRAAGRQAGRRCLSLLSDICNNCTRLCAQDQQACHQHTHKSIHVTTKAVNRHSHSFISMRAHTHCTCTCKTFRIDKCVSSEQMDLSESNDILISHRHSNEQMNFRCMFLQHLE